MGKCTVYGQIPKGFCQIRRPLDHSWSYKAYERQKSMEMSENKIIDTLLQIVILDQ